MVNKKNEEVRNLVYIVTIIIMIGVSVVMVLDKQSGDNDYILMDSLVLQSSRSEVVQVDEDEKLLFQQLFDDFIKLGDWPVVVDQTLLGRSNPFLPTF